MQKEIKKIRKNKGGEVVFAKKDDDVQDDDVNVVNPLRNTTDNKEVFYDCKDDLYSLNRSASKLYKNPVLSLVVYSSTIFVFVQLSTLVYLLNGSNLKPPGLIFLLICIGYLAFMVFKVNINIYKLSYA